MVARPHASIQTRRDRQRDQTCVIMEENFDTEHFIVEVQARPALWDLNDDSYCSRDLKRKSWEELVTIFMKTEDATTAEKNEFGKYLLLCG